MMISIAAVWTSVWMYPTVVLPSVQGAHLFRGEGRMDLHFVTVTNLWVGSHGGEDPLNICSSSSCMRAALSTTPRWRAGMNRSATRLRVSSGWGTPV